MQRYIAYYRVSTVRQGQSGLGLEAQQAAVRHLLRPTDQLLGEYTDIESGKRNQRPQLLEAIAAARQHRARLVIAKLDRLSRNASFVFTLRDSGVDFVCADIPEANPLTIGLLAVIAQHERELISTRTREALAAKKARGFRLGTPANLTPAAREHGLVTRMANARNHPANRQAAELARLYRERGLSLRAIAAQLNTHGYATRRGCGFRASTVHRLLVGVGNVAVSQ